jgi:hypothetical protein
MGFQPQVNTIDPPKDPWADLKADLLAYAEAQAQLQASRDEIKKLMLMLQVMKNPLIGAQMLMLEMMDYQGDRVGSLATVDNLDSDLRAGITGTQGNISSQGEKSDSQDMAQFMQSLDGLQAFLQGQQGGPLMDDSVITNMLNAITSVKAQFTDTSGNSVWGDPTKMAAAFQTWIDDAQKNGQADPQIGGIQSGLQTLNQSTSALSTTTSSQLQYVTQLFQQVEGITNDTMKAYQQLVSNFVHGQKSQ